MSQLLMPSADDQNVWESYLSPNWLPTVMAADELGILSSIDEAPSSIDELSSRLKLNPRALGAVLPMLASLGYLVPRLGRYHLTPSGRDYLLPTSDFYWGGVWASMRRNNPICDRLKEVLTTPDPPEAIPQGSGDANVDGWASGNLAPEAARWMFKYMHSHSAANSVRVARSGLFSSTHRLLDVGGCSGVFSIALAQRHPDLICTIMDLPSVCALAAESIEEQGLGERLDTHPADMFRDPWPEGYYAMFFSNMFHDWRISTGLELAKRAFDALAPGGTINLHEMLLSDDGSGPRTAAAFSVLMVLGTQGQQFTFGQLQGLLAEAGFVDIECRSTTALYSVVRGYKPEAI